MKLTPSQIETIETYLLSWGLEYQDFYEEMLDHFVSDIEQRMQQEDFETAFMLTKAAFSNQKFKGAFGLKAFEAEYIYRIQAELKRNLRLKIKKQFSSWRLVIWGAMVLNFFLLYQSRVEFAFAPFAFIVFVGMILPFLFVPFRQGFSLQTRWTLIDKTVEIRKKVSLFRKTRMMILFKNTAQLVFSANVILLINNLAKNLGVNTGGQQFHIFWLVVAMIYVSFYWAQIEMILEERFKLKI